MNRIYIREYKERCGFGQWHTVIEYKCKSCNKLYHIVKNWHGPKPNGAIACPNCNHFVDI